VSFTETAHGERGMATIYEEFVVEAPVQFVWEAIKDVGAVHRRLAQGFVTGTELHDRERTVSFANGVVVREAIIGVDDDVRRLSYSVIGGRFTHHNASFQVFPVGERQCRVLWVTDLLPDDLQVPIGDMIEHGIHAIKDTLQRSYATVA